MLDQEQHQLVAAKVKPLQIIVMALIIGVLSFILVALCIKNFAVQFQFDLLCMVGLALTLPSLMVSAIFKWKIREQSAQTFLDSKPLTDTLANRDVEVLVGIFASNTVISSALIEGPAFFWVMLYFNGDNATGLIVAAPLASLLLLNIPTQNKLLDWLEHHLRSSN